MRLSRKGIENIRRGLRRSWQDGAHRQLQQARVPDADTLRRRALSDARGKTIFTVVLPDSTRLVVQRSIAGRTDQFDLTGYGGVIFTGRADLCMKRLVEISSAMGAETRA